MRRMEFGVLAIVAFAVSACSVAPPTGPDVAVMPGKDKTFEAFQADDVTCKQYASTQIGNESPAAAANQSAVGNAVLGTALGAAAGAAIDAAAGNPAAGAAIGAGSGLVLGGATGLGTAQASDYLLQQRYDIAYVQCMSAKGENVPPSVVAALTAYPANAYGYPAYYPSYYGPDFVNIGFGFGFHRGPRFVHHHGFAHFRRR